MAHIDNNYKTYNTQGQSHETEQPSRKFSHHEDENKPIDNRVELTAQLSILHMVGSGTNLI